MKLLTTVFIALGISMIPGVSRGEIRTEDPICYMVDGSDVVVDLSYLCQGVHVSQVNSIAQIPLDAPEDSVVTIDQVLVGLESVYPQAFCQSRSFGMATPDANNQATYALRDAIEARGLDWGAPLPSEWLAASKGRINQMCPGLYLYE